MAKKNLASLMNGIMGDTKPSEPEIPVIGQPESAAAEVTEEMKANLEANRRRNVGRPRKGESGSKNNEVRATFIVDPRTDPQGQVYFACRKLTPERCYLRSPDLLHRGMGIREWQNPTTKEDMKKVLVIGCPGAGKSTFARKLSEKTGLPLYYLDMIWHKADRTTISTEEFDTTLSEIMNKDQWILDGNYLRTMPLRLEKADTVFFFDLPLDVCLSGAIERLGKERVDMLWIDDVLDGEFRQWIMDFPKKQLPAINQLLESYSGTIIRFTTRSEADKFINVLYMKKSFPDKDKVFPNPNIPSLCYIKNVIKNPRIIVGDYTYYDDVDGADRFEEHVTHFYEFIGDRLIIGNFCAIAKGVTFVMNGANHRMDCATTYPFYIMGGDWGGIIAPVMNELPLKGDTVIGNDVWIGQNVTIMPGVHIGDGAIIGTNATVASDIPPYSIAVGNPARVIRQRFDDETIELLERLQWWNKPIEEIDTLMPILTTPDIESMKSAITEYLKNL